jgi:integrase/recombinase XerD
LIISLLYGCALRVSELCNLKVKDIDIEKGTLVIWESKRATDPALIPIPAPTVKIINQWIKEKRRKPYHHLLFSQQTNKLSRTQIHRIIKNTSKKAGIKKELSTHSLRRSRATHLLDAGLSIEKVSKLLRHKELSSTLVYLRISIKGLKQAINKIDKEDTSIDF